MWFDIAREYTERWHHQRQISLAVGRPPPIDSRRLYHPVLDAFVRALPYTFRDTNAPEDSTVVVSVAGEAGGNWCIHMLGNKWTLYEGVAEPPTSRVVIEQAEAWRLFTKRTDRATARERFPGIRIEGDVELGERVLEMVSIMA
jgi:hypothetical protein